MPASHGYRRRTRSLFRKNPRERGLPPLSKILQEYRVGGKVTVTINPSIVSGQPHKRYQGKVGTVIGKRGKAYLIEIYIGGKRKVIITRPEHLQPVKTSSI